MRRAITILCVALAALVSLGLVLVYSASVTQKGGAFPFIKMQAIAAAVGIVAALAISRIDYRVWQKPAVVWSVVAVSIALCVLVFKFPKINGSHRWIRVGSVSLQPSEFARIAMIIAMSAWYSRIGYKSRTFLKGFLYPCLILGIMAAPVALSPDVGASVVIGVSCGAVLLAAKVRKRYLIITFLVCAAAGSVFIMSSPNRLSRIMSYWQNMHGQVSNDPTDYHRRQSIEAFVRGGPWGAGIGSSIQKHKYLPEANTDFIFSIAGEELGLVATIGVVIAFSFILFCGVYIAYHAPDKFGRLLALGLTILIVFEASFNIGMVTGCLPTKGLALPFISYGGTSIAASFIAVGLIASVAMSRIEDDHVPLARDVCSNI